MQGGILGARASLIVRTMLAVSLFGQVLSSQVPHAAVAAVTTSTSRFEPLSPLSSPLGTGVTPTPAITQTTTLLAPEAFGDIVVPDPVAWTLNPNLGDVSPFRGNVQYAYPLAMPALPDGLQPQLTLRYSSSAADHGAEDINSLGKGWTLDVPRITQGIDLWSECDN